MVERILFFSKICTVNAIFIFIKEKCGMRSETFFFLSLFSAPCHYPCLVTVFFYGEKAVIAVLNSLAKLASPFFHDACRYTYHKLANFFMRSPLFARKSESSSEIVFYLFISYDYCFTKFICEIHLIFLSRYFQSQLFAKSERPIS